LEDLSIQGSAGRIPERTGDIETAIPSPSFTSP
jgi:hypothetical protein